MKSPRSSNFRQRAFTLIEMLMTTGVVAVTGTIIFTILDAGMVLYAKNTAINVAHQQARIAVMQMEQDIHGGVSVPQMTDANRVALTGASASGPAAGISFQVYANGPFKVAATASSGQSNIVIQTGGVVPVAGQRLIIPTHQIEMDVIGVTAGNPNSTLTLGTYSPTNPTPPSVAVPLPVAVSTSLVDSNGNNVAVNVACFLTDRVSYVVQGGNLMYYPRMSANIPPKVMAYDITTATPFSVPATPLGAAYTRFVAAINLSTADLTSTNRKYRAANMFLNAMEPCRAQLCQYQ